MKNVLIIGAGGIGRRHIKGYLSTNRATLSIVEPDDEKINIIQKEFSIDKTYFDTSGKVKSAYRYLQNEDGKLECFEVVDEDGIGRVVMIDK